MCRCFCINTCLHVRIKYPLTEFYDLYIYILPLHYCEMLNHAHQKLKAFSSIKLPAKRKYCSKTENFPFK